MVGLRQKVRQQLVATDEDISAAEEELNFHNAREDILTEINLEHPIVFDQYNICALVTDGFTAKALREVSIAGLYYRPKKESV